MNGSKAERVRVGVDQLYLERGRTSGTATYSWSLLEQLQNHADLDLVIYAQDGYVPDSIDTTRCEVVSCPTFKNTTSRVVWEQTRLPRRLRRDEIDVVFAPGYVLPRFARCPKVVTVHDMYFVRAPAAIPFVRRQYYRLFIPWSVKAADAVIAVSQNTADDLAREIPAAADKIDVIFEAARERLVDIEATPTGMSDPFFLMVASVTKNKNIDTVVRAAVSLRQSGVDAQVVVAGDDPYGLLAEAMRHPGAADAVRSVGVVADHDLAGLYREAVAVVHASVYEGFGLPVIEAQALGTPVISSRGGALPEVAGNGALYFDHADPDELVAAMRTLLEDDRARAELVERGRANLARFSWSDAAEKTAAVLIAASRS
ncbi:MAG: glycosyltransferase family 4 protein [Acidimicrobiia bacterium]|nr:glycosyltransferase family 4 protein [Acidimicrobiia bacterium]